MTPIFMRIWLMKMTMVFERLMLPVSLRSAWDMRRACKPTCISPISPLIAAGGDRRRDGRAAGGFAGAPHVAGAAQAHRPRQRLERQATPHPTEAHKGS